MSSQNHNKRHLYIRVNDIFDELKTENHRLIQELLFANKSLIRLKRFLNKIRDKYNRVIDEEDNDEVNELTTILDNITDNVDQNLDLNQLLINIKNEINIEKSNQLIKEKILKKYRNKSHKNCQKSDQI